MTVAERVGGPGTTTTRVLVVDDHTTFSDLLAMALAAEPDLECVGTAASTAEALAKAEELRPDVVLMDVRLEPDDGIAATAALVSRFPKLRVVVLTAYADSALMQRASDVGACCLMPKDGSLVDMLHALRTARLGDMVVHPTLLRTLLTVKRDTNLPRLTPRELQVLQKLADGLDSRQVASALGISVHTCRGYIKEMLVKMDAHSQLEAVVTATKHGLLDVRAHD